ncbi:histidine--tRNA ligase [Alkalibaculum sp. M08DMB]|uniref:Histidine--tRNA ligase n=1 Tax=Alkalibaculum sporogenes TaxID=2655001 RepID=A0A6A7K6U1_9FIRM|nr:histidine--tRNA ligase [Alkalibaculum sporogenes]MPW25051.1 histidine--tRNA ligase [Alkalibaculum sporogenes]
MNINTNPVRGTRDIAPLEMEIRDQMQQMILEVYRSHGFERIETPVIENLDFLMNSDGGENLKMLFTVLRRGEKLKIHEESSIKDLCDIGLRYDLTLPLSRFYANNKDILQYPFKAVQIDNVFRSERPQKGRFRSFKQCDIDIIGEKSEVAEIELIYTTAKALKKLGFDDFVVRINDRRILSSVIISSGFSEEEVSSISIVLDKLDKIGVDGVKEELIKKGYDQTNIDLLIKGFTNLNEENIGQLTVEEDVSKALISVITSIRSLCQSGYKIIFDPTLVRGMGYYTGQIFEITYGPYGFSIAGGGRYDNMIGNISKESIPAVGFSIGFERIATILLEEKNISRENDKKAAVLYFDEENIVEVVQKSDELRNCGYNVSMIIAKKKLAKQINGLKDSNYKYFMVFGKDEVLKEIED